jgi:hypothetical protein
MVPYHSSLYAVRLSSAVKHHKERPAEGGSAGGIRIAADPGAINWSRVWKDGGKNVQEQS